jgi:hypothetical protein
MSPHPFLGFLFALHHTSPPPHARMCHAARCSPMPRRCGRATLAREQPHSLRRLPPGRELHALRRLVWLRYRCYPRSVELAPPMHAATPCFSDVVWHPVAQPQPMCPCAIARSTCSSPYMTPAAPPAREPPVELLPRSHGGHGRAPCAWPATEW